MNTRDGFSLIELVVALTVAGVCMSVVAAGTASVGRTRTEAAAALSEAIDAAYARDMLTDLLSGSFVEEGVPSLHVYSGNYDGMPDHSLAFLTRHSPGRTRAVSRVAIYIDRDSTTAESGLTVAVAHSGERPRHLELAAGATSLIIRYKSDGEWRTAWHSPYQSPDAVLLEIGPVDAVPRLIALPILVALSVRQ